MREGTSGSSYFHSEVLTPVQMDVQKTKGLAKAHVFEYYFQLS